jgi:hypothetical protein
MRVYKYIWKLTKEEYDSETILSTAHPEACLPNTHDWYSTFVFGTYDCRKCQVRKTVNYAKQGDSQNEI